MSLSFVSSAILSSSDGISHNEEQRIESKEATSLRQKTTSQVPLFEQLRSNKDTEQEKFDEESKLMKMGSRGLNEEDCAHLDAVETIKGDKERLLKKREMEEVEMFRAARAERSLTATMTTASILQGSDTEEQYLADNKGNELLLPSHEDALSGRCNSQSSKRLAIVPIIITKRKRRNTNDRKPLQLPREDLSEANKLLLLSDNNNNNGNKNTELQKKSKHNNNNNKDTIASLLGAYGSDSDDDDDVSGN